MIWWFLPTYLVISMQAIMSHEAWLLPAIWVTFEVTSGIHQYFNFLVCMPQLHANVADPRLPSPFSSTRDILLEKLEMTLFQMSRKMARRLLVYILALSSLPHDDCTTDRIGGNVPLISVTTISNYLNSWIEVWLTTSDDEWCKRVTESCPSRRNT